MRLAVRDVKTKEDSKGEEWRDPPETTETSMKIPSSALTYSVTEDVDVSSESTLPESIPSLSQTVSRSDLRLWEKRRTESST
jgi:hypothetical protein